ncbi:MAG: AAA family ATPase [Polyangiales bacterium]
MLRSLRVVDFKGIRELEVPLRPLTVFVGANGVGKTTLLEAVYVVGLIVRPQGEADGEAFDVGRWARGQLVRSGAQRFNVALSSGHGEVALDAPLGEEFTLGLPTDPEKGFVASLGRIMRARFDPAQMSAPAAIAGSTPRLAHDGAGLPAVLQYLHGLRDGAVEAIEAAAQAVVPRFRRVQFKPTLIREVRTEYLSVEGQLVPRVIDREVPGVELFVTFDDGAVVPAAHVSEGTLLTLAILTLAHQSGGGPRVVLIDDLDRALHPAAQHRLVEALYKVLAATPGLQILATTHSPDLVDACAAEDVRVLARDAEGNTAARALSEHPEAEKWLKLLRVGEFWGTVGEDWVTARTPSP